ncbi:gluconokinase [Sanguibacter sp. A247]|uniref:gluconokinase n=1 Tax=unclassified Sanguibacter TaxID=2645534 RepID=UPI003FD6C4AA
MNATTTPTPPRLVVMGVSGCGKSTVGALLAGHLEIPYLDADDLHPAANIARMASGIPLTDDDRAPWLDLVADALAAPATGAVIACSALRRSYRDRLRTGAPGTAFVHLTGSAELLGSRLTARTDHFMPASLLTTQLATLEELSPDEIGLTLDVAAPARDLAAAAAAWWNDASQQALSRAERR